MDIVEKCIRAEVNAGVCGLVSVIEARSPDGMQVIVSIESDCPRVQAFAGKWANRTGCATLDAFEELLRASLIDTTPARLASDQGLHPTCLVPVAVLKAAEVAAGLALPCDCSIKLTRPDDRTRSIRASEPHIR
jgi:hypothetical protein